MDVKFVNPFILSTKITFKTMLESDVIAQTPGIKKDDKLGFDVSGIIGLSGTAQGAIALCFSKAMALKIVSKLINREIKIVDREVADGIGEIANIIAGNAKQHLSELNLSISLPRVVVGNQHRILEGTNIPVIVVPFTSEMGNFAMEVALKTA